MRLTPENDAVRILVNPYSVITLKDELFQERKVEGTAEDWVFKNDALINEMGTREWLDKLLHTLTGDGKPESVRNSLIDPFEGLHFSPRLQGKHDPIVDRELWLTANEKAIQEIGTEKWLWLLIDVLETGGIEA